MFYIIMEDNLLQGSCYICHELCHVKSPCECEAYVHNTCLQQFTNISNNKTCTICKTRIVEDSDSDSDSEQPIVVVRTYLPIQLIVLIIFIVYFMMGIIGQLVFQVSQQKELGDIFIFWSGTFFMCSCVASACIILPTYIIISCLKNTR